MKEDDHVDLWERELREHGGLSLSYLVSGLQFGWRRLSQQEPQMRKRKRGDLPVRKRGFAF